MRNLSKSKIIAFRQCPKRLWLEIHKPELRDDSASEAVFKIGHQVGDIARSIYDPEGTGETIDINTLGHTEALKRSAELLSEGKKPLFEAGLSMGGALAYADVMLPDQSNGSLRWRMIEVKSSTGVKAYHQDDIAVQAHIALSSGVRLASVSLAHIDNNFVYQGDGDYRGLLHEVDLTSEALSRSDEAKEWLVGAHAVAAQDKEPEVATGPQCTTPFTCGFCDYCNRGKVQPEFPLDSLPKLHYRKREQFESEGYEDLRKVPDHLLNDIQRRVKECSVREVTYFDGDGAKADLARFGFPAYFLDFETVSFAVPIWKGTRPYQQIPFQFSLHRVDHSGSLGHTAFLDLTGMDPSKVFGQSLIEQCGSDGPVYVYNAAFESTRMRELASRFPELEPGLSSIIQRVVDLLPIARNRYYHPSQHGSWSIKAVLPALCPELSYAKLDGVQDGEMAIEAFKEAIALETTPERKREVEQQLLEYCKLDTLAMVRMWQIFSGATV
jgi:predicted RecB family nuclease